MEIYDVVYTSSNKIKSLCSFAIFPIGISVLETFSPWLVQYALLHQSLMIQNNNNPQTPQSEDTPYS